MSVPATAAALFALGIGWNLSFVAATAELLDRTQPWERGKLLGFNDLLSGLTGAALALIGGAALTTLGVTALAVGGAALVLAPALWISRLAPAFASAPVPAAADHRLGPPGDRSCAPAHFRITVGPSRRRRPPATARAYEHRG